MEFDSMWHLPGDQDHHLWHHCRKMTQTNGLGRQGISQDTALWMPLPFFQTDPVWNTINFCAQVRKESHMFQ